LKEEENAFKLRSILKNSIGELGNLMSENAFKIYNLLNKNCSGDITSK